MSNKDKRIDQFDIKSPRKKHRKPDFLRLNNSKIALRLVQSSKMKTTKELITQTNFKVLN